MKFFRLLSVALLLSAALLAWPGPAQLPGQQRVRAIILSCDGSVPSFINDLLRQGKLPNIARLIAGGTFSDSVITAFPSKTAPGHASLWTGTASRVNGITGNIMPRTPRNQFTILDSASGFHSTSLRVEPLWISAARSGRKVVVVQATQAWPFETYTADGPFGPGQGERLVLFEGYAGTAGRDGVKTAREALPRAARRWKNLPPSLAPPLEINFSIGMTRFFGLLLDDPRDPTRGYDSLIVTRTKDGSKSEATLKPGLAAPGADRWSAPVEVETAGKPHAGIYLRLFDLKADGKDFLLYHTRPAQQLSSRPELLPKLHKASGPFVGNGASRLYAQGAFGAPMSRGGDGIAERRYLETVRLAQRQLMEATRWAMRLPWDLIFSYLPFPDEAEHLWRGYLEPGLRGFRKDLADRLRPYLEETYRTCDEFIGVLTQLRPADTVIALVSDHGMEGVDKLVAINAALKGAGLLILDGYGKVDLAKSRALYPEANNGYLLINTRDRKGGIVKAEERAQVIEQIRRALQEIRDGERQVVTGIFDGQKESETMGIGGESGGDIYIDLLPGYGFDSRLEGSDLLTEREPYGIHLFSPTRRSMRTIMVLNGPGVAPGNHLQDIRTIDFAPTLARLVGIAGPRAATGRVLAEALAPGREPD